MSALVIVRLRGGDAGSSDDAVCVDLDPGLAYHEGWDWQALVHVDRIDALLARTGAKRVGSAIVWDGEPFGDGNGGTVEFVDGKVVGNGLNRPALEPEWGGS